MNKQNMKKYLAVGVLLVAVLVIAAMGFIWREKPVEGSKEIVIEVINSKKEVKEYELKTDAEYLRQAMDEAGITYEGSEGEYGLMIEYINGERANYAKDGAYWGFYVNNEYSNYGIDSQPVEDGDVFQIIYTSADTTT